MANYLKRKLERFKIIRNIPQIGKGNSRTLSHYILRKDAGEEFEKCLNYVFDKSGIMLPSAGAFRPMLRTLKPSKKSGRSQVSLHCLGLAVDIATWIGGVDPKKDMIIVDWKKEPIDHVPTIYLRTDKGNEETIAGSYIENNTLKTRVVTAKVINLTELLNSFGFYGIPARSGFLKYDKRLKKYTNKINSRMCWEFWHFQYTKGLIDLKSSYGEQLGLIYKTEDICDFPFNNYIFKGRSFHNPKKLF